MCLIAIALDQSRRFPLVVAANRDEFFSRPATRLGWWSPGAGLPDILGGRDLEAGGTWLGLTAQGRLGLITNVRDGSKDTNAPSRGSVVPRWLSGDMPPDRFWMQTALSGYNGFNLIAADFRRGECFWASNNGKHPVRLERGLYGVSNAGLDTPWPKVTALKNTMGDAIQSSESLDQLVATLFDAMSDRSTASDETLPSTGISRELEKALSAAFIRVPETNYGTRCTTLIVTERINKRSITHVLERTYSMSGGMALMRRAQLKDWPPRYADEPMSTTLATVTEGDEIPPEAQAATSAAPRKTRVRSLLKPEGSRRKRPTTV